MTREDKITKLLEFCLKGQDCSLCKLSEFEICREKNFGNMSDIEITKVFNTVFPNESEFTKDGLQTGMVVELRNGDTMCVVKQGDDFRLLDVAHLRCDNYNEKLLSEGRIDSDIDIVAVYEMADLSQIGSIKDLYCKYGKEIWRRNKTRMTKEEIEKALGFEIEIVDKEEQQ